MQAVIQFFKDMGPTRLAAAAVTVLTSLILFILFLSRIGENDMSILYTGLDVQDSAGIVQELEKRNIRYEVIADGGAIKVPKSQVVSVRLTLAQEGMPSSGSVVGYEIFDKDDSLGATNFSQNVKLVRALEGELSRTIAAFDQVEKARVHLVMPQREIFSKERMEPRASVVMKFKGNKRLGKSEIDAISHLIVTSVPGLEMKSVTIVDTKGAALKIGSAEEESDFGGGKNDELKIAAENRLRNVIEELLSKTLGPGKVKAQVALEMNFDRTVTNSEVYDPDGSVVRSTQSIDEKERTPVSNASGQDASVANNIPGGGGEGDASKFATIEKSDQTTNYEVSKTIKNHISESGVINKMSIGILVDGIYNTDVSTGEHKYTPRSSAELDKIAKLVKAAVGFDIERGDKIEVENMQFVSDLSDGDSETDWIKEELPNIFQTLIFAIVVLLILITVIRPIALKAFEVKKIRSDEDELGAMGAFIQAGGEGEYGAGNVPRAIISGPGDGETPESGQVGSSPIQKINDIADTNPQELVNILRKWLNEE